MFRHNYQPGDTIYRIDKPLQQAKDVPYWPERLWVGVYVVVKIGMEDCVAMMVDCTSQDTMDGDWIKPHDQVKKTPEGVWLKAEQITADFHENAAEALDAFIRWHTEITEDTVEMLEKLKALRTRMESPVATTGAASPS